MDEIEKGRAGIEDGDYIAEIRGMATQFDVFRFMKRVTADFGTRAFMVLNLPSKTSIDISSNSVITNWPVEFLTLYDQEKFLSTSPLMRRVRVSVTPMTYDVTTIEVDGSDPKLAHLVEMCEHYSMPRGACFPVHDATGARGAVLFSGDRQPFERQELMELSFIAIHVFERMAEIRGQDGKSNTSLTEREIDCLNWTAAGKTSAEIAEILSLSEHTVNHYLNRATKKLDTVNRTQAVVKAMRTGIIK